MSAEQNCEMPPGMSLVFDEETRGLKAKVRPVSDGEHRVELNATRMQDVLEQAGFGDFHVFEETLMELLRNYARAVDEQSFHIAERRDAKVFVTVSGDGSSASITVLPACGGNPLTRALIDEALAEAGVVSGLQETEIERIAGEGIADNVVIARGRPVEHGQDSRFENLLPEARDRRPRIDDSGVADYTDLGGVVTVEPGQSLMRRHPPGAGVDGLSVLGEVLPASPGKQLPFARNLEGVEADPGDPDLLRAARAGLPVVSDAGVTVEQVLVMDSIDLSSGNISFEGTVTIKGDVRAGLKVEATGDIIVGGTVEAARLIAGGDISITGGIIGHASTAEADDPPDDEGALIRAGGTVTARFCEFGRVEADTVNIGELMTHSHVVAGSCVTVGRKGARKGQLIGGRTRALMRVDVMHLGSPGGVATVVEAGMDQSLYARLQAVESQLPEKRDKLGDLHRLAQAQPPEGARDARQSGLMQKISRAIAQMENEIAVLEDERATIAGLVEKTGNACVRASRRIYGGVQVRIRGRVRRVEDECVGGVFSLSDGEVQLDYAG